MYARLSTELFLALGFAAGSVLVLTVVAGSMGGEPLYRIDLPLVY